MSDSKDKKNKKLSDDFADDLDAILNDAESSIEEQDELIDDEDVIDQLLVDDEFSADEQIDSKLEDSIPSKMIDGKQQDDNPAEIGKNSISAEKEVEHDEFADEDEFNVDDLLDSVDTEVKDEFSEAEMTDSNVKELLSEESLSEADSEEVEKEVVNEDLIDSQLLDEQGDAEIKDDMLDFDISADDELLESDDLEYDSPVYTEPSEENSIEQDNAENKIESADFRNALDAQSLIVEKTVEDVTQVNSTINELNAQVSQLWADNEELKELVATLTATTAKKDDSAAEEIDSLQKEQRKLKKAVRESESKVPTLTYVALGVAVLALLVAGILGAIGYGAKTDAENLTELVATLEEEIEIITAKDIGSGMREVNFKINALKIENERLNELLDAMNKSIRQSDALKAIVDDLAGQNDHAQKAIESLLASVETLEQQKRIVPAKRRVKKTKKPIVKVEWVVNLVSFKQEWYAKRKSEEFKKKGIPAIVEEVNIKGKKWFRLRVKGFKSKYEAAAYAVKVKKTLNLSSVWVTKATGSK